MWFSRHFLRHICSTVADSRRKLRSKFWLEKNVQQTTFEAAEMMLGPWNQQRYDLLSQEYLVPLSHLFLFRIYLQL